MLLKIILYFATDFPKYQRYLYQKFAHTQTKSFIASEMILAFAIEMENAIIEDLVYILTSGTEIIKLEILNLLLS